MGGMYAASDVGVSAEKIINASRIIFLSRLLVLITHASASPML